ncbi:hypothetical protein ABVT39_011981 [Epinephelus coioides]
MSPIKDLQVVYDALNENVTFSAGDVVTGTVSFNLTEDTEVKGLIVKVKGDAHVRWTEGTGDRRRTHHAYRRYFKVKEFLIAETGDTIDVFAKIHNSSSKKVKPKVSLMQQVVYRAMSHRRTSGQCLWKYTGDSLENKEGTISCQVKIPDDAMCTVADCDIISVTNILKVYVDVSFSFDPEVVFPLDIVPFQPGVAPGPYPAAAGGPSYSDFPPPAFPVGPYPGPAPIGPGAYGYPPAGPTQPANMISGYNNPWQPQAVPYGFPAAAPSAVQHPAPTAPPLSQQGEQPPSYTSLYPPIQPTFSGTGPDHKY